MYKILTIFILLAAGAASATAQVLPADDKVLNARIAGFSIPEKKGATKYMLEVARGKYTTLDFFEKNIIVTLQGNKARFVAEIPAFGAQYTWRISVVSQGAQEKGDLHHFSTGLVPEVDTTSTRLSVKVPSQGQDNRYIFVDGARTLYDLNGNPVWYVPDLDSISRQTEVRDLKASRWGSITFLANEQAWEVNYDGAVIWNEPEVVFSRKMPVTDRLNYFHHHQLTRLTGGQYMTIGMERKLWEIPGKVTRPKKRLKTRIIIDSSGNAKQQLLTNKIVTFDSKHSVTWSWSFADYLKTSDIHDRLRPNGMFKVGSNAENDCYLDEQAKTLYVSMSGLNRIVKVHYPDGKLLNTYGPRYIPGNLELVNDLFCRQHSPVRLHDSLLCLYNSNSCSRLCGGMPSILLLREPAKPNGQLKKVWEYECQTDSLNADEQALLRFDVGGSVCELADRSLLCCMGGNYGRVFIVSRDKKILWSALPEMRDSKTGKWVPARGYRASIITRKELESLIWNEPLKK